jgi:small subunit ribosomal protein S18
MKPTEDKMDKRGAGRGGDDRGGRGGGRGGAGGDDRNGGGDAGGRRRFPGMDRAKLPPGFLFDYKNPLILRNYVTEVGKVMPGRVTRLSAKQQRQLTVSIKRARHLALLPYNDKYKKY